MGLYQQTINMSKELAEKLDLDGTNEEAREEFEELIENNPFSDLSKEELEERIERARNGEYLPKEVDSWEELWKDR
jgi:hypothetical protein